MKREIETRFYCYNQNNSGGKFKSPAKYVIIEAISPGDADRRAQEIGLYFNGVEDEIDCSCCGDRWDQTYEKGSEEPEIYDMSIEKYLEGNKPNLHKEDGVKTIFIKYFDGTEKTYG